MEWVRAFVGSFEIRPDASELEGRRKDRTDRAVILTTRLILQFTLRRRVIAPKLTISGIRLEASRSRCVMASRAAENIGG